MLKGQLIIVSTAIVAVLVLSYRIWSISPEADLRAPTKTDKAHGAAAQDGDIDAADTFDILFLGDISFGENFLRKAGVKILEEKGYDFGLKNFAGILKSSDAVIANLDTTIINPPASSHLRARDSLHWSHVEKAPPVLKAFNFRALSLAGENTLDFGSDGLDQTVKALEAAGIGWFGAGRDETEAQKPYRLEQVVGTSTFKMAVLGITERSGRRSRRQTDSDGVSQWQVARLDASSLASQIEQIRQDDPDTFVVVYPSWGHTYRWKTEAQQTIARSLVEAGADFVVGHGSHMMQEVERYKNRWILYGLGNFLFNSPGRFAQVKDTVPLGLVARLSVRQSGQGLGRTLRIYPIHTDNKANGYQGRLPTIKEYSEAYWRLIEKGAKFDKKLKQHMIAGQDRFGRYLQLPSK